MTDLRMQTLERVREGVRVKWLVVGSMLVALALTASWLGLARGVQPGATPADRTAPQQLESRFPVTIRQPDGPPRVDLGVKDEAGNSVMATCATCHRTRPANRQNRVASDLTEFHQGLTLVHGSTSCLSCHNAADYDSLALADGTSVDFTRVMDLCAQCHGPQTRDYLHGAHGGMTGHWDLSRGPQTRNNCVDCHNPHAPSFPKMTPTFKPRDRFLHPSTH